MTCAGYLVVDNSRPAFVEICTGVLVCSLLDADAPEPEPEPNAEDSPSSVDAVMENACQNTDGAMREEELGLPPLGPRRMPRLEVLHTSSTSQLRKMADEKATERPDATAMPADAVKPPQRVMQLSGFLVEVEEREHALDAPSLPCSFQVNTYKLWLQPDGSSSSELHDSLILTATDDAAKQLWVKHLKFWNRFGWRDTLSVHAEAQDLAALRRVLHAVETQIYCDLQPRHSSAEAFLRPEQSQNCAVALYAGRSSLDGGRPSVVQRRPTRRRFYRSTGPGNLVPPP